MTLYRGMDRAALDAAYNNSAAVANSSAFMAELRARGDRLRAEMPQHLDLRYGPAPRNRIDYFSASAHGPVLRSGRLDDAFDRLRVLAGAPIVATPGQELLDSLLEPTLAEAAEP